MAFVHNRTAVPLPSAGRIRKRREIYDVNPIRRLLFGHPVATEHQEHTKLPKILALPTFSSDAISSVAYATQQILLALGGAGLWVMEQRVTYARLTMGVTLAIVVLLAVVVASYWQTIFAYPSGGGSYIVSKENLGVGWGLVAAAALLLDYILTVAVSIASGVQNFLATPLMAPFQKELVLVCILCVVLITFANLRGLKESGALFALPTYSFIFMGLVLIILGITGLTLGWWRIFPQAVNQTMESRFTPASALSRTALIFVVLRAFANGCSAMTGTEAVSNGIPAFQKPESRNAAITLTWMGIILGTLLTGISWLAAQLHVVYWETAQRTAPPVIDQLSAAIFGKPGTGLPIGSVRAGLYYAMQFSTLAILVVAAQTSFADFPRLSAILARDRFAPRQLANQGDKLVFSNGILVLGTSAVILLAAFHGSVDRLIPLYAVGVFTAFTLSQSGMVVHWRRLKGPNWRLKMVINGIGAAATFIVLANIIIEKAPEGAWIVIVVAAILIATFVGIHRHYEYIRKKLSLVGYKPDPVPFSNTVLLLVPSLHRGIFPALEYARSISPDCRAIHIEIDPENTPRLLQEWEQYVGEDIPLVILPSPYRSVIGPLMAYLEEVQRERPHHVVTVVVPEFVSNRWWHSFLHNANGLLVKLYLMGRPGVIVANVRYFLDPAQAKAAGQQPIK